MKLVSGWSPRRAGLLGAVLGALLAVAGSTQAEDGLLDYAQPTLRDFTAQAVIVQKNEAELGKIGKNFAQGYRFRESLIRYKEPLNLRIDAKAGLLSVRYTISGHRKRTQVPGLHINVAKDITGHPGEEQGMLDSGILTPAFLANAVASRFVGQRLLDGRSVPVFEFWYTADVRSRRHLLWIDPEKRFILRHDVDDRHGHPWVRYQLSQPLQVAGLWVPTRLEVYNDAGHLAAVTLYSQVKVNTGLSDSLFGL
jgi:hypothetical protein